MKPLENRIAMATRDLRRRPASRRRFSTGRSTCNATSPIITGCGTDTVFDPFIAETALDHGLGVVHVTVTANGSQSFVLSGFAGVGSA